MSKSEDKQMTRREVFHAAAATPVALAAGGMSGDDLAAFVRPARSSIATVGGDELGALAGELSNAQILCDELGVRSDEVFETYIAPPIPEALLWQSRDFPSVWIDREHLDGISRDGQTRYTYASDGVLDELRRRLATWRATAKAEQFAFCDRDLVRVEEIVTNLEAWEAEERRRLDAGGQTAISKAFEQQCDHVDALRRRLAVTPAATAEGVRIKVWAARGTYSRPTDLLRRELNELLGLPELRWDQPRDMLLISAMIDAEKLDALATSSAENPATPAHAERLDVELLDLGRRWLDIHVAHVAHWHAWKALSEPEASRRNEGLEAECEAMSFREWELEARIQAIQAKTMAGLAVKARIVAHDFDVEILDVASIERSLATTNDRQAHSALALALDVLKLAMAIA